MVNAVLPFGSSTLEAKGLDEKFTGDAGRIEGNTEDLMNIHYNPLPDLAKGEELAINVGSNCYFISFLSHLTWLPDQAYKSGSWGYIGGENNSGSISILLKSLQGKAFLSGIKIRKLN